MQRVASIAGIAAITVLGLLPPVFAQAPAGGQQPPAQSGRRDPANAAAFAGRFRCIWTSPDGFVYECEMQLRNSSATELEGRIQWTLVRSPQANEQAKVGKSGAELVRGVIDSPGKINLTGYDKVDPDGILGLDEYRLELSGSTRWVFGSTSHHGSWDAHFVAIRY